MDASEQEIAAAKQLGKPVPIMDSLQKLWRKIFVLLRQHPFLLWSPLLIADIAKYWTALAGKHLSRAVIYTLLPHSVFSGRPDALPPSSHLAIISLLAGIVTWISYAFSFFLYSAAFIFIANCVHNFTVHPDHPVRLQGTRLLVKALQLAVLLTCLSLAAALLSNWIASIFPVSLTQGSRAFWVLLSIVTAIAAAIFAAKPFLRAASFCKDAANEFTSRTTVLVWILLSCAVAGSVLLSLVLTHANVPLPPHPFIVLIHLYGLLISLITAMPYVPMMIGIALLAEENP